MIPIESSGEILWIYGHSLIDRTEKLDYTLHKFASSSTTNGVEKQLQIIR